jgi:hypothetical protein
MSAEHVAAMNAELTASAEVRRAASKLVRDYVIVYELTDGPHGGIEYWQLRLGPGGVAFALAPAPDADVRLCGTWRRAVAAARASRDGRDGDTGLLTEGDLGILETVGPVLTLAQQAATLPVAWPDLPATAGD